MCQDTIRKYLIISLRGRIFVSPCWDTGWEHSLSSLVWGEFRKEQSTETCSVSQTSSCSGHLRLFTRHRAPLCDTWLIPEGVVCWVPCWHLLFAGEYCRGEGRLGVTVCLPVSAVQIFGVNLLSQ